MSNGVRTKRVSVIMDTFGDHGAHQQKKFQSSLKPDIII